MKKFALICAAAFVLAAWELRSPCARRNGRRSPIRIVVSFGAGGGADIIGRILAESMQEKLGKPVVIENRPGRRRHLGQRSGRERRAGRLHARDHDRGPDHRRRHKKGHAIRHAHRVRAGDSDRNRKPDDRDARGFSGQQRQGIGRRRQSRSGQDRLREPGLCRHPAFCR